MIVTYGGTGFSLAFSLPRAPQTERMMSLLPKGTAALIDWPVAFFFPCLQMSALTDGAARLPRWRLSTPRTYGSGAITTDLMFGGPLATPRDLVREQQVPVYLVNDMLRHVAELYRWEPITQFASPTETRSDQSVPGWRRSGRVTVPGLDPVP
jgi:arabinosyltransferase A/arabinosyltransferase B/arabinosyltransferase C